MWVQIERWVTATINEMAHYGELPQVPVDPISSPSAHKSICASIEVQGASTEVPKEQRAIEGVQVDGNQWYPVDDICQCTACELHKPFDNITMKSYMQLAQLLMHDSEN
jgi:hypothetical protein